MNIAQMSLRQLRTAVQNNRISFPSQVPIFGCQSRPDIQWRLVELYFVQNWSCSDLGQRYGVTMERVRQLISQWAKRAAVLGYLQEIPEINASAANNDTKSTAELALSVSAVSPTLLSGTQVHTPAAGQ